MTECPQCKTPLLKANDGSWYCQTVVGCKNVQRYYETKEASS
jgi:uncharacterized Zn finger protein (UPF0148 family)